MKILVIGSAPFKPLEDLTRADFLLGLASKTLGQIGAVQAALKHVSERGSITVTTGVLARDSIAAGAAAAAANGALESFVVTAAAEAPRGIRINAVSPDVLANSPQHFASFPGHEPISDERVATAYVLAVEGLVNGRAIIP